MRWYNLKLSGIKGQADLFNQLLKVLGCVLQSLHRSITANIHVLKDRITAQGNNFHRPISTQLRASL